MTKTGIAVIGLGPASLPHAKSLVDLADHLAITLLTLHATADIIQQCSVAER